MTGHLVDPLQHLAFRRDFTLADMECRKGVAVQQLICACTGNAEHFRKLFGVQHFGITVKSGSPIARAAAKQMICRFVRLKATFVLIFYKSLGTGTYAK